MRRINISIVTAAQVMLPVIAFLAFAGGCSGPRRHAPAAPMTVAQALTGDADKGYEQADAVRQFVFPADHGEHPGFKTEWWYFTGNVKTVNGREFGYQFTIFRYAIRTADAAGAKTAASASHWDTSQIYMADAALSDISTGRFYTDEQFSRGALGMAGVKVKPLRIWLNQWSVAGLGNPCQDCLAVELTAAAGDFRLHMQLNNTHAVVLHGRQGLSAKSAAPGNASYYYSYMRLLTNGQITLGNAVYPVTGDSWFDHEWSSSALGQGRQGWDWFALQLSDRSEVMVYRLRDAHDPDRDFYYGSLVRAGGSVQTLDGKAIRIHSLDSWRSPDTGIVYPSSWNIDLPRLRLTVTPKMPDQEVNNSIRYWEGAVTVSGTAAGADITGQGYVELTGYQ